MRCFCDCLLGCKSQITNHTLIIPKMSTFRTYAITFRPSNGVDETDIAKFTKWACKQSDYYHIVTEKDGYAKHIHAALFLKKSVQRSNVATMMSRLFKELDSQEKSVMLKGIKILYNYDWISNYLDKDDDTVVIASNLPEKGHIESWFPPKPVTTGVARARKCSAFYHELESLWMKYNGPDYELNTMNARAFLNRMMNKERVINVISDPKKIKETAGALVRFIGKIDYDTYSLAPFENEESY